MNCVMQSTVFVRPNLKAFVVGAILLLVVQHLISNVHSQGSSARGLPVSAREVTDVQLQQLIRRAAENPSGDVYMRISHYYEARGEYRKALLFLRLAEKLDPGSDQVD